MKRKIFIYTAALFLFCTCIGKAQITCGSDLMHQALMKTDSAYRNRILRFESQIKSIIQAQSKSNEKVHAVYTIPVVVHVIHVGEAVGVGSNILDAQIYGAISGLNSRWRNSNGIGVDTEIEFCLATRDPNGNPTSGINRVDGSSVSNYASAGISGGCCADGAKEDSVKALSRWPVSDYYNIWVVKATCGNCAGYAYPPTGLPTDGAVILYTSMTDNFTAVTHEVGHGFGLYHTFQGDENGTCPPNNSCTDDGDKVCDTPPHQQGDCGSTDPCTPDGVWDNSLHNYMSYCAFLDRFTAGQKDRMRAAASVAPRLSLLSSLGCTPASTGISEGYIDLSVINIYPNPNNRIFEVTFNVQFLSNYKLELRNILGQLIFKDELVNFTGTYQKKMNVVEYGNGIYTLSLSNSKNEIVKKIVVY